MQIGENLLLNLDSEPQALGIFLKSRLTFLSGFYFAAPTSLSEKAKSVKAFFSLPDRLQREVDRTVSAARQEADILIGTHIRHGDYKSFCEGIMYYSLQEYASAMSALADQFPGKKVAFLVCSDEVQDIGRLTGLHVMQFNHPPVIDMYCLSGCDYILGPNSSFSHWASFFGDVPLHIFDWKAKERYGDATAIRNPSIDTDFSIFMPSDFGRHAAREVTFEELGIE